MENRKPVGIRVICPDDCGNAPKKAQLRDFTMAAVQGDIAHVTGCVSDNVEWEFAGGRKIIGKAGFADAVRQLHDRSAVELEIRHILTHGKTGAVSGVVKYADGGHRSFCDVYVFAGSAKDAKIRGITSYVIDRPG